MTLTVEEFLQLASHCQSPDVRENLTHIIETLETLHMDNQEVLAALAAIDATTNGIGGNIQVIAASVQQSGPLLTQISSEVDALVAAKGVSPAVADSLAAIKTKLDAAASVAQAQADALNAQVPVLTAIAAKGSTDIPAAPGTPDLPPPPPPTL